MTCDELQTAIRALVDAKAQLTVVQERYDKLFFAVMEETQRIYATKPYSERAGKQS
jgi:hypothetical protein